LELLCVMLHHDATRKRRSRRGALIINYMILFQFIWCGRRAAYPQPVH
jgi:hypothetical protein